MERRIFPTSTNPESAMSQSASSVSSVVSTSVPRTISQGLRRVKKLKGLLSEAQSRATSSTSWVAGKKPVFDFGKERKRRAELQDEIIRIESAIARANATTTLTVGEQT